MKRRHFLLAGASAMAAGWWLRPDNLGAPYSEYFRRLNLALQENPLARPLLVIDRQRLAENCKQLVSRLAPGRHYRIVAKSLPSIALIAEVMALTGTQRVMTFHQPFTNEVAARWPNADILLGKPMPVAAAASFYQAFSGDNGFDPSRQLQWLIDDLARLQPYLGRARQLDRKLLINIEIDVGLHRGGLTQPDQLDALLQLIANHPEHLAFAGFMGYDAHVGKLPAFVESWQTSLDKAQQVYRSFIQRLKEKFPTLWRDDLTLNGAGSPTALLHGEDSPLNEISAGSCLLKPVDFDLPSLDGFVPAAFIATPVIKSLGGLTLPGPLPLGDAWSAWDINRRNTYFIYGGNWLAKPESPAGLQANALYGVSSNQMMYNGSPQQQLKRDDFIFLRPTQSESVLLQFGDLAALSNNGQLDWWPPLPQ